MKSFRKTVSRYGVRLVLFLMTGLWLALALHYGLRSAGTNAWSPFGEAIYRWLTVPCRLPLEAADPHVFGCMTANEAGDFLAGFFAPLAFLWLAAAVFIQSKELREQRRELALTRGEFELNREVATKQAQAATAQADAAQKAAEMAAQQTRILQDEYQSRLEQRAFEMFHIKMEHALVAKNRARFAVRDGTPSWQPTVLDVFDLDRWLNADVRGGDKNVPSGPPPGRPAYELIEAALNAVKDILEEVELHFAANSQVERERHKADLERFRQSVERAEAGVAELVSRGWWVDQKSESTEQ